MEEQNKIIIYKNKENGINLDVNLKDETIWLSQKQMAELFHKNSDTVGLHLKNIYKTGELSEKSTTEEFSVVQKEGDRSIERKVKFYNLDAIISVGYRVNSKQGTQFRIWATNILRKHLVEGYTINEKRLKEENTKLNELKNAVELITNVLSKKQLEGDEAQGLLQVITEYAKALELINQFDHDQFAKFQSKHKELFQLTYQAAAEVILTLRLVLQVSDMFGQEKDESFKSSIASIYQTFDGKDLYPTVEEKAANLLYFIVKNHSFGDGNKRIGAFIFIWFLEKNNLLTRKDGSRVIPANTLVALTLMIAESKMPDKAKIIKVVTSLIE